MASSWKPKQYSSVSPYVMARGAQRVIDFAKEVFGATELRRHDTPDGGIMHAEFRIDDSIIMIADGEPPGGKWPAFPTWMHVYVSDVDEVYRRALAAGGVSVQAPSQREGDPDRRSGVKDPAGNTWWIASQVS